MSTQRVGELISAAMDNELSRDEREELLELMKEADSNVRIRDDFEKLDQLLRKQPQIEPPEHLRETIMASVELTPSGSRTTRRTWLPNFNMLPVLRYGLAAAAGVLLTVAVYRAELPTEVSGTFSELTGTMAPQPGTASADIVARESFKHADISSELTLQRFNSQLLLSIALDAAKPAELTIDLAGSGTTFDAVEQIKGTLEAVFYADQVLRIRGRGRQQLLIILRPENTGAAANKNVIAVGFSSNGEHLGDARLETLQ